MSSTFEEYYEDISQIVGKDVVNIDRVRTLMRLAYEKGRIHENIRWSARVVKSIKILLPDELEE